MDEITKGADLRFASDKERRFALAYLRWLAGGVDRRESQPYAAHQTYGLSQDRGRQIRNDIQQMVLDAAPGLQQG